MLIYCVYNLCIPKTNERRFAYKNTNCKAYEYLRWNVGLTCNIFRYFAIRRQYHWRVCILKALKGYISSIVLESFYVNFKIRVILTKLNLPCPLRIQSIQMTQCKVNGISTWKNVGWNYITPKFYQKTFLYLPEQTELE